MNENDFEDSEELRKSEKKREPYDPVDLQTVCYSTSSSDEKGLDDDTVNAKELSQPTGKHLLERVLQSGKNAGNVALEKAAAVLEKAAEVLEFKNDGGTRTKGNDPRNVAPLSEAGTEVDFCEERTAALEDSEWISENSTEDEPPSSTGPSRPDRAENPVSHAVQVISRVLSLHELEETVSDGTLSDAEDLTPDGTEIYLSDKNSGSEKDRKSKTIPTAPPQPIPGYEFDRFLGSGAYGEVWIAVQVSTMRRVAVKFYTHHSQNIEFLTQEVEKLSLLFSDQNVVQLLEVGWEAKTPYYIMEYLENGSLADAIARQKTFSLSEASEMFEVLLRAMCRAHQKGIIHCDLKPGNILMDQSGNPRLADFGQSRLTNDMAPALGTLFFMPPEQAMIHAHADVRWDVYALGAIFYTMLMGRPPHYTPSFVETIQEKQHLPSRMGTYRRLLQNLPVPTDFRQLKGMSLPLAQLLEKCLQPNPENRFQSMEELQKAWIRCKNRQAKFPLLVLGMVMPVLLLLIGGFFVISEFECAFRQGVEVVTDSTLVSGQLAAEAVAKNVENEITHRRSAVEQLAGDWQLRDKIQDLSEDPQWVDYAKRLGDSNLNEAQRLQLQTEFTLLPQRQELQETLENLLPKGFKLESGDELFFCDRRGIASARIPLSGLVGHNFLPYLTDGTANEPGTPFITETSLSEVFLNPVLNQWSVSIAAPVFSAEDEPVFLGILFMTVDIGNFVDMEETSEHFVTLVDLRPGKHLGLILEHPLYNQLTRTGKRMPETFMDPKFRVTEKDLPDTPEKAKNYHDPLAASSYANGQFAERWLAASADVDLGIGNENDRWVVITQKSYDRSIGTLFNSIEKHFWWVYVHATVTFLIVIPVVWFFIHRIFILRSDQ